MSRPGKVIHLVEGLRTGGLEKMVRHIVVCLNRTRFDPEVWCLARGGEIAEEITAEGIPVRILQMGQRPSPRFLLGLTSRLRAAKPHILHCHGYTACTVGRVASVLARTPRVFAHVHTQGLWLRPRQRRIEQLLAAFTTKIVCVSESVRQFVVQEERIPRRKTEVIYNGIPDPVLPSIERGRQALGVPEQAKVITCIASLEAHKGHAVLIDAAHLARARVDNLTLVIVGEGSLRADLEHRARQVGIAAVFAGRMADVSPALAAAEAVALLSTSREGLPLAVIEAMAASRPVVGSRLGGLPEAVENGVNGFLCSPGDPAEAADAIVKLFECAEIGRAMSRAGRRIFLERFTVDRMMADIERLYGD